MVDTAQKRPKVAWSDDMSHDSEAEREKERQIQLEKEIAAKLLEKPKYEPEKLQQLIDFIMKMTTLYDLRDSDWTDEVKMAIEDWILEPKALMLCIYFSGTKLKATSDMPLAPVYDLTYFLRKPDLIFQPETFHDDLVFGTFVDSVESNLIQILETVYAPYFFAITTWPESVKSEFCSQIHTFLAKLTDMYYKMLGLTVLYIPREGQQLTFEKASTDRELVKRLEGVVVYWTHQIKSCLEDTASVASQKELLCPSDEYDFWIYRHENLSALLYQIKNPAVRHITKILVTTHSTFIHQFQALCDDILQKIREAKSNIEYLQVIKQPCAVLECVVDPDEISIHVPVIINLFRFIWMESPFYNSQTRITNLFKALSNQIIILCRNYISLNDLFDGETKKALGEFSKCIDCCKKYREIYDVMAEAHSEKIPDSWNLDTGYIFNYIDSFIQRCFDMIDVCNCMIIFGRIDEMDPVPKPIFGGARGEQFEEKCVQIEQMFLDALQNVRAVSADILDVQAPSWYDEILQFRTVVKDIEIIIENLVETVFEGVNQLEEAVVALFSLNNYSRRNNLKRIFKRKTANVWSMFSDEVHEAKKDMVATRSQHPSDLPSFAGRAAVLRMRKNRLVYLKKVMTDAAWMMPCSSSEYVIMHVNRLTGAIEVAIRELWISWTHNLDEKCAVGLNRTLMRKSADNPGLMECNIDVNILELCKEAAHWENLGMDIPQHAYVVYAKSKNLLFVYESVLSVTKGYNKILDSLSDDERQLFKPLTVACEKKIQPGISKLTWTSTMSDAYIADCVVQIGELRDFVNTYKNSNLNIIKIMENICNTPFIDFDIYNVFEINDLRNDITAMETKGTETILEMYKEIIIYLVIVYEGFEAYIGQMAEHWVQYVRRFDRTLEDAIRLSIKATMQNMYKCVHGDGTMAPSPLIKMNLYLTGKDVIYLPSRNEIQHSFSTILQGIILIMDSIPRLFEKFSLPAMGLKRFCDVIRIDTDSNKLQVLIDEEVEYNIGLIHEHMRMWEPYSSIWKVDKDSFLVKYGEENHTAAEFEALINNYGDLAHHVQVQETINQIHFITLNSSNLKKSIIKHCMRWQLVLGELLRQITENDVDAVYAYVEKCSEEAMQMPADLKELAKSIATYDRLMGDLVRMEKTFPPITDKVVTLGKFEVELSSDMVTRHEEIPVIWTNYLALLEEAKKQLELNKDKFKAELLEQAEEFKEAAKDFCDNFYQAAPVSSDITGKDAMSQLKAFRDQLNALRAQEQEIRDGLAVFNLTTPVNLDLQRMEKELEKLEEVWGLVFQWEESWEKYKTQTFWEMETDEMEENVMFLFRNFNRLSRQLKDKGWDIIDTTRVKVDAFRRTLPLIGDLKNPCMRERHWDRIRTLMAVEFDQNSEDFKLDLIMKLNFQIYADEIAEISKAATMELNIENGLKTIREIWKNTTYEMAHHRDEIYRIKNVEDVMQFLEDHQVQLSSMKSTKYVEPFIKEVDYWEKSLGYVAECIEIALQVQRRYLYLETIFGGEDIRKQLPKEVVVFDKLTADWTDITKNMYAGKNAVEACLFKPAPYVYNKLNGMIENLDGILRSLEVYLETKRQIFPRFYFISNDDLLEILGNSKKPQLIQVHLKKLFDNVVKIRIDKDKVVKYIKNSKTPETQTCHRSLLNLQRAHNQFLKHEPGTNLFMKNIFFRCVRSAIYSHDWDKLLYLLTKSTIMVNRRCMYREEINTERIRFYLKAYTILLMNHPYAKANLLLDDYMHMVLSCRSQESRQAVLKVLVTLTDTLYSKVAANLRKRQERDLDGLNALGLPVAKAMMSEDGECIEWRYNLILDGPAEIWLLGLENTMRTVLRDNLILTRAALRKCKYQRETWINDHPGQLGITCSKIMWTSDCTRTLARCELMKEKKPMKKLRKKQNIILNTLQAMSRKDIPKILRAKVNALCVIEIHSRDMVDKMYKMGCMTVSAFEWFSQLKFYWDREREDCYIRQTNTCSIYTYEYIGNSGRLVITPLTDRCYITLTTALNLFRGGSPQGPAGTGKTETTKDLGRALARWVVVTNCSDGLDYKSMAKCYSGIAQSGCWGCFDEFNRINIEVLSVVAQQILAVLLALSQQLRRFVFEGAEIKLDPNCGIFITMNPGYAGRTELPDNLKSMFRPIAMCVPDCLIIAEITLFSDGFTAYKINAKKVFTLYELAMQQLSKQDHYDFGLRSMVALLRYAGSKRRLYPHLPEQEVFTLYQMCTLQLSKQNHYDFGLRSMIAMLRYAGEVRRSHPGLSESEMVILAMRDMNVARLTAKDVPLFDGIMQDIFPDVVVPTLDYEMLETAISAEMKILNLQPTKAAMHKVIQTFETKNSRHSSILLGDTNTAKSVSWKILAATISRCKRERVPGFENVQVNPMNPKALTLGELYGEYNLATGEWKDGVLSSIMRTICQDESPDLKWIIFDGPVDAIWIENLNSVMDDNKLLTLVNSERISMPSQVSLLIETLDLAVASPATVSRNGMVYNDYKDWGWWPFVNSWLDTIIEPEYKEFLRQHFLNILTPVLELKRLHLTEGQSVRGQELTGVRSMCRLLGLLPPPAPPQGDEEGTEGLSKMRFLFAMIWSICATLEEEPRRKLDNWVREHEGVFPLKDTVYDYYVDERLRQFKPWDDRLPDNWRYNPNLGFHNILVPTVEFIRVQIVALDMLKAGYGVLIGGPTGTGKTFLIQGTLASLDPDKYSQQVINMSAQTTAANVQDMIEARLEKRTKGNYVPAGGKKMIAFMDDINMPVRDEYGSQPPLELMRLWHDYGYWFDRDKQWRKNVRGMVLCGAAGPPGGARSPLPPRLLSCFHAFYLTPPAQQQLIKIFGTMLSQHMQEFDEETKSVGKIVLYATIDLFNNVVAKLLPTPSKMHYLFNLRDISKIFQGLLRSNKDYQNTKRSFLRLWICECFRVFGDRLTEEKDRDWFMMHMGDQLGKHFELTFHAVCPTKTAPIFGHFLNPFEVYDDISDPEALRKYIANQMEEYNSCPGVVKMDLVLFKDAIEHIARIVRVISQQRGNVLCVGIGGSGRQSLTRVASYICECNSFQVVVTKTYGVKDFKEDLKTLYTATGVDAKKTTFIFSDTQIADETFTEIVNNLLSSGEVTNLFKPDEFEDIKQALEKPMKNANILQTNEAVYLFLVERVRANLRIVLCFSPIGEEFRNRIRQYPALINATTTNWFLEWPREALLEVAYKFLEGVELLASITGPRIKRKESLVESREDGMRASVASTMSLIHSSVGRYSVKMYHEMRRTNYVTPTNYLELVAGYKEMLKMKRQEIALQANKLRNGLGKVEETTKLVGLMSEELAVAKVQVAEYTEQCIEYMGVINVQQRNADEQQRSVAARSKKTQEEEVQCKKLAEAAMRDLASAMPALEEAVKALDALNKKDITEVKSYAKPPYKVEMVMEAVLILLQKEPTWPEAKRQLGDQYFLDRLREFDKDNISDKTLKKIGTYTIKPDFDPEIVGTVSAAAKSLCLWVRAIEKYGKVYKIVKPKKERLEEALESLRMKQQILAEARAKLRELSEMLARLQAEYDEKLRQKEELEEKSRQLLLKLERAEALITGLSGERERWEMTVERLDKEFDNLPGDCLIATGFVAYLGPFVSEYRESLMSDWFIEVYNEQLPVTMDMSMKYFLLDDAILREWNSMGLPEDNFSAENGIIVVRATRWPLAVDPQGQALIWISKLEENNDIQIVDFGQPNYMKVMETCLTEGKPIIVQGVGEILDPSIAPILDKAIIKIGNSLVIKFNEKMVSYNPKFKLYITTKLGNPTYTPEILTKTTMVNFAVKEQGLTSQLLGIVVRKERPQLEIMKDTLVTTIANNKKILVDLENDLLRIMYESTVPLLDNEELFITLQTSQRTSLEVKEALITSQVTEKEIDAARAGYVPVAVRASVLFFALNDLSRIDPMYQFSLDAYTDLFHYSIDRSPKNSELEDRINNLNEFHTYAVYKNTCRAVFERHKLLLSFHMVARILFQAGKMNMNEYLFLLKGGVVLDRSEQPDNPTNWLPDDCWDNLTEMDKLPGFHGIVEAFEVFSKEWKEWYLHPEPETQPLLGDWNDNMNDFQKILFIRSLRVDRVSACITTFIVNVLGPRYVEPPVLDIKASWEESSFKTSLLFVLSPGVDPTAALIQLATEVKMFDKFQSLSLGQGQAPTATRFLATGMREGGWVFLANCHLACAWLGSLRGLDNPKIHPRFRLWLSSMPDDKFPLHVLQRSIKMTTEPPQGLKGNMVRVFANLNEDKFDEATPKYRRLLFCVSFFHCSLIARKRFRQLGYNAVYSFNDADFDVSDNLLASYLEEYEEVPWDALRYLFAIINYGGHITDDWDKRVLIAYINQFFCEEALDTNFYRLSSIPAYHIPRDGSLESYRDFLDLWPGYERAESVGQHASADVATLAQDALILCSTLFALASTGGGGAGGGEDQKVDELAAEMVIKLPNKIDVETTERMMGPEITMPMCVSLLQEIGYFNKLISSIVAGLKELRRAIEGLVVMSEMLEIMYHSIFEGRVPKFWQKARPSMKPLGAWCRELFQRGAHLNAWANAPRAPPTLCWLPALVAPTGFLTAVMQWHTMLRGAHLNAWANAPRAPPTLCWLPALVAPTGFLTAVMQTTARGEGWPIDTLCWEFTVMSMEESSFVRPPRDGGVYVRGLYLEGASWFRKDAYLQEPLPMQLVFPMTPIHFKPVRATGRKLRNRYICPCYYYPLRMGAFVVAVDLPSGKAVSDFWVKRGTALLCTLAT